MKRRNAQKGPATTTNGLGQRNPPAGGGDHRIITPRGGPRRQGTIINASGSRVPERPAYRNIARLTQEGPKPRDGHVSIVLDNNMFVFGGDRHQVPFNDLFFLPVEEL
jgi:hypothetical protein